MRVVDGGDVSGKSVILRVDFNEPVNSGIIIDDFRIRSSMDTLKLLIKSDARIILISHRSDGGSNEPLLKYFGRTIPVDSLCGSTEEVRQSLARGKKIILLENVRYFKGEEENDLDFAKEIASLGEVFVNEAFSASHRKHASIVSLPKYLPSFAGIRFDREVKELQKALNPGTPASAIVGGVKLQTKIPLITKLAGVYNNVFVGGLSAVSIAKGESKMALPENVVSALDFIVENGGDKIVKQAAELLPEDKALDIGPDSLETVRRLTSSSKFIIWNGPMGFFEGGYTEGTNGVADIVSKSAAYTIVGGGDTLSAIKGNHDVSVFSFVSTGGGAMLEFLTNGTLPGIEALSKRSF
ncbi:MAG: hypothetical protein A3G59_02240 [Candidatus Taylorbacteria bacterium RIFCSPLOWO2_12_FULL_47_20]|uniref:Phosphoglycerate kinase n=2 Tax=Candidatus Tayloriibacteriota TaxID=1817919 RepID=A0A1G2PA72_9BACT|nr:MAG: hypothetical protein A3H68_03685 [Candidatus Taylorbacteria bacterium RIFCSPLOWO2_02_FULL_46_40]OHA44501.1 MAG: hypothetical protein A3G59_02240 [Candidatus Taylorbacteria bacterium RIFCSPLOWO2_12_FULL_47_20]